MASVERICLDGSHQRQRATRGVAPADALDLELTSNQPFRDDVDICIRDILSSAFPGVADNACPTALRMARRRYCPLRAPSDSVETFSAAEEACA